MTMMIATSTVCDDDDCHKKSCWDGNNTYDIF